MAAGGAHVAIGKPASLLQEWEWENAARQAAEGVKTGTCSILDVVEILGTPLKNEDSQVRAQGIQVLSEVLLQCYSLLQEQEGGTKYNSHSELNFLTRHKTALSFYSVLFSDQEHMCRQI
ncbi:PREDICTED: MMS19 nucleotide excision repair protein homolog [Thamnophis sirtalis]|uniref:MMS19 nucleotide excision repair protein homolog n=1 Tax=Thamnophis sirtalis TaxID=35019 RepID=A0A6I9YDA6_9SAUR|nr:PREDICTED: MMS19 nucleotide excision repair protein homolog [Thamnophis sirtalis]